ncbi:MAG: hypothetical protein V9H26_01535 [Verrucomicrobiota bacterium]
MTTVVGASVRFFRTLKRRICAIGRGSNVGSRFKGPAQRPFHVRLAAAHPHIADQDVGELDRFGLGADREDVRSARPKLAELELPRQVSRDGGDRLVAELDGNDFAIVSPTPDGHGLAGLENHVIGEQRGGFDGGGQCQRQGCEKNANGDSVKIF